MTTTHPGGPAEAMATATPETVARLEAEIRHAHATVRSGIANRRDHPSFGYTKAHIRAEVARLFALVEAWALTGGAWTQGGRMHDGAIGATAGTTFGFDLHDLRRDWM